MPSLFRWHFCTVLLLGLVCLKSANAQDPPVKVDVHWDKVVRVSQTTPTLQVVVNPPLRRGTPVHDNAHKALRDLGADYVRYVPWLPYPKLGVAELEAPKEGKTSWDFSVIDPMTIDFLEATKGHSVILNFVEFEHHISPEVYTRLYDEVVTAVKKVQPDMKFVGLALAMTVEPRYFEYFLDHKNHKPDIPLDFISYHFYAVPTADQTPEIEQFTYFDQADGFLKTVRYVESIRKRLSPETKTTTDELGVISADDIAQGEPGHVAKPIPNSYWNLAGSLYAYLFGKLTEIGIDVAGESQLVGFPTQFPSVSMVDWNNGNPNARFWVLKLLHDNFHAGDKVVEIGAASPFAPNHPYVYSLAFVTQEGKRRVLLVNKRDRPFEVSLANARGGQVQVVDQTTAFQPPTSSKLDGDKITLGGFSVAAVTLP